MIWFCNLFHVSKWRGCSQQGAKLCSVRWGAFPAGWRVWSPEFCEDKFPFPHSHMGFRSCMVTAFSGEVNLRQAKVSEATLVFGFVCMVRGLPMLSVLMSSWRSYGNLRGGLQAFRWGVDWLWLELHSFFRHTSDLLGKKNPRTYVRTVFCIHLIEMQLPCV